LTGSLFFVHFSPMQTFTSTVEDFGTDLWGHHFWVPEDAAAALMTEGNRRVICSLNGQVRTSAALMPDKGRHFILLNKQVRNRLGVLRGDQITVTLESDTSEYGMEMPEEFQTVLLQDEPANRLFHTLTPGKQRALIHIVGKVKNTDSRIRKALAIAHHLNETEGIVDFKLLNVHLKFFNSLK